MLHTFLFVLPRFTDTNARCAAMTTRPYKPVCLILSDYLILPRMHPPNTHLAAPERSSSDLKRYSPDIHLKERVFNNRPARSAASPPALAPRTDSPCIKCSAAPTSLHEHTIVAHVSLITVATSLRHTALHRHTLHEKCVATMSMPTHMCAARPITTHDKCVAPTIMPTHMCGARPITTAASRVS